MRQRPTGVYTVVVINGEVFADFVEFGYFGTLVTWDKNVKSRVVVADRTFYVLRNQLGYRMLQK